MKSSLKSMMKSILKSKLISKNDDTQYDYVSMSIRYRHDFVVFFVPRLAIKVFARWKSTGVALSNSTTKISFFVNSFLSRSISCLSLLFSVFIITITSYPGNLILQVHLPRYFFLYTTVKLYTLPPVHRL